MILPAQSYLANCPDAIAVCTTETALAAYKEMSSQFNSCQFAGDPWSHVDVSGRASFLKSLTAAYKNSKTPLLMVLVPLLARLQFPVLPCARSIGLLEKISNLFILVTLHLVRFQRRSKNCDSVLLKTKCT